MKTPEGRATLEVKGKIYAFQQTRDELTEILEDQNNGNEYRLSGEGADGEESFSLRELREATKVFRTAMHDHLEDIFNQIQHD